MSVSFTRKAYLEVWRGQRYICRHTSVVKAAESASIDADEHGSGDYYITIGGPPQPGTAIGPDGLPHVYQTAGQVYYMARADVTIRFSEGAVKKAYPIGAAAVAGASAPSAEAVSGNDIEVAVAGVGVTGTAGSVVQNLWLGKDITDEFGAIAQNDNHANTIYEYQPLHAPTIPTLPYPTGDVSDITSNRVGNAADEYFVFNRAGWELAYNNATYKKIFIAKGADLFDTRAIDTLTVSGTAQNPRWFIYWDNDLTGADSTADPRPWNQSERVQMPWNILSEASHVYFVGLSFGIFPTTSSLASGRSQRAIWFTRGASDSVVYRCFSTYAGSDNTVIPGSNGSAFKTDNYSGACGDNITWFECVIKDGFVDALNLNEFDHISIQSGSNHKIISCEISDPCNANIQFGPSNTGTGHIVEDCDLFKERRYSSPANMLDTDANGTYAQGDSITAVKRTATSGAGPHVSYLGNRIWGGIRTSNVLDPGSASSGYPIVLSDSGTIQKILIKQNVIWDSGKTYVYFFQNPENTNTKNHTIAYNLFTDTYSFKDNVGIYLSTDNTEFYRNTVNNLSNSYPIHHYTTGTLNNFDCMGNFIQNCTATWVISGPSGYQIGYNGYAGTHATPPNIVYGNNDEFAGTPASGSFIFWRKKLTDPNRTDLDNKITIANVVPTSATPTAFLTGTTNANIGSRQGIGVDDEAY